MDELSLFDCFHIIKLHLKTFLITFAVSLVIAVVVAMNWSNYRSTATVEVELPEISVHASDSAPDAMADQMISRLQQKVLSTGSLVEIISKFNLYPAKRAYTPISAVAGDMLSKIKVDLLSTALANPASAQKGPANQLGAIAFMLSFDYNNPAIAQQVTNELVSRFIDEDLKRQRAEAEETSAFLASQLVELEKSISEQEKKIAEYRASHGDIRPDALAFNQQTALGLGMSIQNMDTQISSNEGQQGSIRTQLAIVDPYARVMTDGQVLTTPAIQLKALEGQLASLLAQYSPSHPDVLKVRRQIESLKTQTGLETEVDSADLKAKIADLQTNLSAARKTYGEKNPDVIALQRQLKNLEQMKKDNAANPAKSLKTDANNPAYLQLAGQLETAEKQHTALVNQRRILVEQQAKYQNAITANPATEQELAALSRDYDNARFRYRELKEKKMAADMSAQMQEDRKGQHLVMIDPPEFPLTTKPSRLLLLAGGFALSLVFGMIGVVSTQIARRGIVCSSQLAAFVGVAPLTTIPHLYTNEEKEKIQTRKQYTLIAFGLLIVLTFVVLWLTVMPPDVMLAVLAHRLGLS